MEIKTINQVPAVINFNFDDVKTALQEYSEKYKDLVVTEENEKEMVNVKNELGRLEKEIDKYRLDNKKIKKQNLLWKNKKHLQIQKIILIQLQVIFLQ